VPAEIIDLMDIDLNCSEPDNRLAIDREVRDGVVTLKTTRPACGRGEFRDAKVDGSMISGGRVYRNYSVSYQLPEAFLVENTLPFRPVVELGRQITVRVRAHRPARFLIERGSVDDGFEWFDVP
jgi:hypothetical protein